jgi:hypothetical protein
MTTKDEQELIRLLDLFFSEINWDDRNILYRNKVVLLLREKLTKLGRWKNLPRGQKKKSIKSSNDFAIQFLEKRIPNKSSNDCPF